jgi:hypothetical protein
MAGLRRQGVEQYRVSRPVDVSAGQRLTLVA